MKIVILAFSEIPLSTLARRSKIWITSASNHRIVEGQPHASSLIQLMLMENALNTTQFLKEQVFMPRLKKTPLSVRTDMEALLPSLVSMSTKLARISLQEVMNEAKPFSQKKQAKNAKQVLTDTPQMEVYSLNVTAPLAQTVKYVESFQEMKNGRITSAL